MNCHDFQQLLNRRLDGEEIADSAELAAHLVTCGECRSLRAAARRFEAGLRLVRPSLPPADLAHRIVTQVFAERHAARRRRYTVRAVAALAAALLLAVLVGAWATHRDQEGAVLQHALVVPVQPEAIATMGPSLRESMTRVAQLTIRSADETMRNLLPSTPANDAALAPLSTSVASLREAGSSVTTGLEPVTDSAKRALSLFLREIPSVPAEDKRGS